MTRRARTTTKATPRGRLTLTPVVLRHSLTIVAMRNWLICASCLLVVLGHSAAAEASQQAESESRFVGRPVPVRLAIERAVDRFVARQVERLESSPLSRGPGAAVGIVRIPANALTNTAGFLLKMMAGIGGEYPTFTSTGGSPSALERYRVHRLDAPPSN